MSVIEELPASEIEGWEGYFVIREEERKREEAKAKAKSKGRGTGRGGQTFGGKKVPDYTSGTG